jgi:drug/metabolite transporter (DMT)-like permease
MGTGNRVLVGSRLVFGAVSCETAYTLLGKRLTADLFMAVMPVSALLLAYVLLGETFSWVQPLGMVIVLTGLAALVYDDLKD